MTQDLEYVAGSCNIGKGEIRRRQFVAVAGLFLTVSSIYGFYSQHAPRISRLGTFLPALIFAIGYLQSRKRFCLAFGFSGIFNFGTLGKTKRVISPEDRALDRKTAIKLLLQSITVAAVITGIVFVLPLSPK
jgi:hypothetical protein